MDIAQSGKQNKPKLSPYQEGVSKALKASGEAQASEAIMQGVPPQHIEQQAGLVDQNTINQLMQLAGTQVASKSDGSLLGDKIGILPAILKTLTGTPTSPFQQKTQRLGLDNAIQLAGFQQTTNKNAMESQKFPMEIQKLQGDIEQQPLQAKKLQTDTAVAKQNLRQNDPNFRINMKVREKSATDFAELAPKVVQTANILNQIAEVMPKLGEYETTLMGQMGGRTKAFTDTFSKNQDFVKFDRLVNKVLPGLARTFGDTGVLNDKDIIRWQKVLGDKTATIASKIEAVNELMSDAKIGIQERMDLSGVKASPQIQKFLMDFQPIQVPSSGKSDNGSSDVLTRLGLDPNKYEVVSNG